MALFTLIWLKNIDWNFVSCRESQIEFSLLSAVMDFGVELY